MAVKKLHPFEKNGRHMRLFREQVRPRISQERLAVEVGITRRHMVRLEAGEHLPSADLRDRIAATLGVDKRTIKAAGEDGDDVSSTPLTREEFAVLGHLVERLGGTIVSGGVT